MHFALVAAAFVGRLGDGLKDFFIKLTVVEIWIDVITASEKDAIGAAHSLGNQRAFAGDGRDDGNAAGREDGTFITHRQADGKVAELEAALLYAGSD